MSIPVLGLLLFCLFGGVEGRRQKCLHEYRYGGMTIKYGRAASVKPDRDVYYPEDVVRFRCPAGYSFQSPFYRGHQEMWIKCLKGHRWLENWPICRGPLENVTCENLYFTAESHGKHWLNETVNEFHAMYSPKLPHYHYGTHLRFKCPQQSKIYKASGLTVMTSECLKDGEWTREWPMCKGRTCKYKYVKNGIINDKNKKLSVGITLSIKCEPGYYLWGPNQTTCLSNLEWSGYPQECVTLLEFRKNCEMDKRIMKIKLDGYKQKPYCYYKHVERGSNHYKIAVGISVPMAIGFIIFIVTASFYVKHQRMKMARERASYIRQQHRQNRLLLSLPSYEDAVKSIPVNPPPTFEETFGADTIPLENTSLLQSNDDALDYTEAVIDLPPRYNDSFLLRDLPPEYSETASPSAPIDLNLPSSHTEVTPSLHSTASTVNPSPECVATDQTALQLSPELTSESTINQLPEPTVDNTSLPQSSHSSTPALDCGIDNVSVSAIQGVPDTNIDNSAASPEPSEIDCEPQVLS